MISFDEARQIILNHSQLLPEIKVPFEQSLGYFLADPLTATCDIPLFNQSAVDGYAVRTEDIRGASQKDPVSLKLIGEVAAGADRVPRLKNNSAIRVLTGGQIPAGADAVIMKEFCTVDGNLVNIQATATPQENIRFKGEEFKKGEVVLAAETRITPPAIGLMASFGSLNVSIRIPPKISIVVTGNEVVVPTKRLKKGQIRDANSYSICAALRRAGIDCVHIFHCSDDIGQLRQVLKKASANVDVVMTIGGVSVGEYDLVKEQLSNTGVETVFWKVAVKPGMPFYFGVKQHLPKRKQLFFGLPGNPVSALLLHQFLVLPALKRMMGEKPSEIELMSATLIGKLKKKPGRLEWVRAKMNLENNTRFVVPVTGQGSHMLGGLAVADCLIRFPENESILPDGSIVEVIPLDW